MAMGFDKMKVTVTQTRTVSKDWEKKVQRRDDSGHDSDFKKYS